MKREEITLRPGTVHDLPEMKKLFRETIEAICSNDYTHEQLTVWVASVENEQRWLEIAQQFLLVATTNNTLVGFCSLHNNYVDLLYVHKDYQAHGIASMLYEAIEAEARRRGETSIHSDVSKTAKAFFTRKGFETITEQTVVRQGVTLTNFRMRKNIFLPQ